MSSIISLEENNCKSCLKCVRNCPTKAITFANNRPEIIESECLSCGRCYLYCPQNAKDVKSDLALVKAWLKAKEAVVISVAPSFPIVWPNYGKLKQGLLELGFLAVEETAKGAAVVSSQYSALLEQGEMQNIIETCCPVIVRLVETRYPRLIPQLSPVASPMIVHGRMLKEKYPNAKVVFLSPCIAKQNEMLDPRFSDAIDAVISMPDMDEWLLDTDLYDDSDVVEEDNIARLYPVSGGIIKTIEDFHEYKRLSVEGLERCEAALKSIDNGHLKGFFFEMNACLGGCLGGPYLYAYNENEWLAQSRIFKQAKGNKISYTASSTETKAEYEDKYVAPVTFSEEQIDDVLQSMGKANFASQLNCGACGYNTCREKSIAVLQGKSDPKHCLPYALENAESMSHLIIEHTPNGIIVLDSARKIKEINPSAIKMLHLQNFSVKGFEVEAILPSGQIRDVLEHLDTVRYFIEEYPDHHLVIEHAVIPINEENASVIILMDLTEKTQQEERLKQLRRDTVASTQRVIDKQMRVVQEIASLLGETTAETKVVLTNLNKTIDGDLKK